MLVNGPQNGAPSGEPPPSKKSMKAPAASNRATTGAPVKSLVAETYTRPSTGSTASGTGPLMGLLIVTPDPVASSSYANTPDALYFATAAYGEGSRLIET